MRRDVGAVALVLLACVAPTASGRSPRAAPAPSGGKSTSALERAAFELVNRHRLDRGLPALRLDPRVADQARSHSADMAAGNVALGHAGFDGRVQALRRAIPWRATAENVAFNRGHSDPAAEAVRGWLASRAHRENIEGPYEVTGVGVASNPAGETYFTQIFVGR